ncbi:hypothetical protein MSAN_00459300 [Mycena sanguinolenta]|uniref:Uncharacterized protein n=1 Tax=Mycena sanguinolenta TaxID=230812 RepID=A0A8H7DHK6_9AGAR|nr:hypothetical protein MSAN_00459300 [Mycena sanguinolenta]
MPFASRPRFVHVLAKMRHVASISCSASLADSPVSLSAGIPPHTNTSPFVRGVSLMAQILLFGSGFQEMLADAALRMARAFFVLGDRAYTALVLSPDPPSRLWSSEGWTRTARRRDVLRELACVLSLRELSTEPTRVPTEKRGRDERRNAPHTLRCIRARLTLPRCPPNSASPFLLRPQACDADAVGASTSEALCAACLSAWWGARMECPPVISQAERTEGEGMSTPCIVFGHLFGCSNSSQDTPRCIVATLSSRILVWTWTAGHGPPRSSLIEDLARARIVSVGSRGGRGGHELGGALHRDGGMRAVRGLLEEGKEDLKENPLATSALRSEQRSFSDNTPVLTRGIIRGSKSSHRP